MAATKAKANTKAEVEAEALAEAAMAARQGKNANRSAVTVEIGTGLRVIPEARAVVCAETRRANDRPSGPRSTEL